MILNFISLTILMFEIKEVNKPIIESGDVLAYYSAKQNGF